MLVLDKHILEGMEDKQMMNLQNLLLNMLILGSQVELQILQGKIDQQHMALVLLYSFQDMHILQGTLSN